MGQNRWEEIDLIERGGNYGWNLLEGNHCFSARDCDPAGTVLPVWEYSLDGQPCSVIGGYVYRGTAIPWLQGVYVYGDFCSGEVFGLRYADGQVARARAVGRHGPAHHVVRRGQRRRAVPALAEIGACIGWPTSGGVHAVGVGEVVMGRSGPTPARYMDGLESLADGKNIIRGLIARGYSDGDVRKIAGGNALAQLRRVMG